MNRDKNILLIVSCAIVLTIAFILYFQPPFLNRWLIELENKTYDRHVRLYHKPLSPHPDIAILAIDDASLDQEGRWPWNRSKIAQIAHKLHQLGAKTIAFDIIFSEPEQNPVELLLKETKNLDLKEALKKIEPEFDQDQILAKSLKETILGFALSSKYQEQNTLPSPLFVLTQEEAEKTLILNMKGYISNLSIFQEKSEGAGFINTTIDKDGILRFTPLLLRHKTNVYPSLALKAASHFLQDPIQGFSTQMSGKNSLVESIQLKNLSLRTDPWGRILIPFRGKPYSFPYLSAKDLLNGDLQKEQVEGKLIFVGLSATASTDSVATAISPVFPGVELQATVASGIIDGYLPYKPNWGRGGAIFLVLALGLLAAFFFPRIGRIASFLSIVVIILVLQGVNYWLWTHHEIVLSFFFPMPTLAIIFVIDLLAVYIEDQKAKKEVKRLFGHVVSKETLHEIIQKKSTLSLAPSLKEISAISVGVWDFSALINTLNEEKLIEFFKNYFSHVNQEIFKSRGLLEEAIQDEIFAFWGAPFDQPLHPLLAVQTAIAIQLSFPSKMGIGIDTGSAFVGKMAPDGRYTAIGNPIDLSLCLKNLTKTYAVPIIVSEAVWKITQNEIRYKNLNPIQYKGKEEKIFTPITSGI